MTQQRQDHDWRHKTPQKDVVALRFLTSAPLSRTPESPTAGRGRPKKEGRKEGAGDMKNLGLHIKLCKYLLLPLSLAVREKEKVKEVGKEGLR